MENDKVSKDGALKGTEVDISKFSEELERCKEEKLVNLIIEIVVSSTLKQYYEKSHPIPSVQSVGAK